MKNLQKHFNSTAQFVFFIACALFIVLLIDLAAGRYEGLPDDPRYYEVTQVFDGDTIEVLMDGRKEKVRLIGIDTPETGGNGTDVECYGKEATDFTKNALEGEEVRLVADTLSTNRDRYDRLLRFVYRRSDNADINLQIIEQGFGPAYRVFPNERSSELIQAEEIAKENNLGLWGACGGPAS